ncbi:hypothetical protein BKA83DRAFT_4178972 [Pisolithus microcarpus]|nr:hypothetical protein BKA83DRAFT_4178972 [Pisolithus microcarpus]
MGCSCACVLVRLVIGSLVHRTVVVPYLIRLFNNLLANSCCHVTSNRTHTVEQLSWTPSALFLITTWLHIHGNNSHTAHIHANTVE